MASNIVNLLIGRMVSAVNIEKLVLEEVSEEIEEIKHELISMRSFLKDADKMGAGSEGEETWITNVRDMAQIMGWLMDEEPLHSVILIVGLGGLGKTTLVFKIYTDYAVKRHFEFYAWITVFQSYDIEDLFRSLIKELHKARKQKVRVSLGSMEYKELVEWLESYLDRKRYLVVLDDVWDMDLWRKIKMSLPNSSLGSRVIITTRREDIDGCPFGVRRHVHHIQPLREEEA